MTNDVNRDRLERLREDLAALRARTAAEFGPFDTEPTNATRNGSGDPEASQAPVRVPAATGVVDAEAPRTALPFAGGSGPVVTYRTIARPKQATRPSGRQRPPRPPRRVFAPRARRPPARLAVPVPIPVGRRPDWLAGPRWPTWDVPSAGAVAAVGLLVVWQLAHRLVQAMLDTSPLLGADPTRAAHLHAAAGVAGGGLTLALAVAALGVVRGRTGYVVAAAAVIGVFCAFPTVVYTANAGVVSAPLPDLGTMVRPPGWDRQGLMVLAFWIALASLVGALVDLGIRSGRALRSLRPR